jgi:hypothetical protein
MCIVLSPLHLPRAPRAGFSLVRASKVSARRACTDAKQDGCQVPVRVPEGPSINQKQVERTMKYHPNDIEAKKLKAKRHFKAAAEVVIALERLKHRLDQKMHEGVVRDYKEWCEQHEKKKIKLRFRAALDAVLLAEKLKHELDKKVHEEVVNDYKDWRDQQSHPQRKSHTGFVVRDVMARRKLRAAVLAVMAEQRLMKLGLLSKKEAVTRDFNARRKLRAAVYAVLWEQRLLHHHLEEEEDILWNAKKSNATRAALNTEMAAMLVSVLGPEDNGVFNAKRKFRAAVFAIMFVHTIQETAEISAKHEFNRRTFRAAVYAVLAVQKLQRMPEYNAKRKFRLRMFRAVVYAVMAVNMLQEGAQDKKVSAAKRKFRAAVYVVMATLHLARMGQQRTFVWLDAEHPTVAAGYKFNARRTFRAAVDTAIAMNRLKKMKRNYRRTLSAE